jgi:hypothetical protein
LFTNFSFTGLASNVGGKRVKSVKLMGLLISPLGYAVPALETNIRRILGQGYR